MTASFRNPRAASARLRYIADASLDIRRVKKAGTCVYLQNDQRRVRDAATLKRIESLVIPPAWSEVRICGHANGHLQATGRDARGRKQYIYHSEWRIIRDRQKFGHLLEFATVLPRIRRTVQRDLSQPGLTKTKALAAVVRLLELSRIRVGNEEYARNNNSFGLTTLRDQHVHIRGEKLRFNYRGKSGKEHSVELADAGLARVVARCQEIPGQELFQYFDENRRRRKIKSGDVNRYLRECTGGDFTAKDFRTWAGTVLMAETLGQLRQVGSQAQTRKNVNEAIRTVAAHLGNTPAICRKCYVHPAVIDTYLARKNLWSMKMKSPARGAPVAKGLPATEAAVLRLLHDHGVSGEKRAA